VTAGVGRGRDAASAAIDGNPPQSLRSWGWRAEDQRGSEDQTDWHPKGDGVGWLNGDDLYLDPAAAHAAPQRLARDAGSTIPLAPETLRHRLKDAGPLRSFDERRHRLTIRKVIEGTRRYVLHVSADALDGLGAGEPAHLAQPAHQGSGDMTQQAGAGSDGSPQLPCEPTRVGARERFII
jgi:hypothetical protein